MVRIIRKHPLSLDGNPIYYRTGTDGLVAMNDILVQQEYGCLGDEPRDPKLIVDCGPTDGYTTLFFLHNYKKAHVIAIEPDPENVELCRLNFAPYAGRVTLLEAAIWPEPQPLVLRRDWIQSDREWASRAFAPGATETATVQGIDLSTILRDSGFESIDLLKLSTNSEADILAYGTEKWLPNVRNIVTRLIEKSSEDAFFEALSQYQFFLTRCPTLMACTNIRPAAKTRDAGTGAVNMPSNGSFEDFRLPPARIVAGGWEPGSDQLALNWRVSVCDPQFVASLAVRTGNERRGMVALCLRSNGGETIPPNLAPYVAVENVVPFPVCGGELWDIGGFIKTAGTPTVASGVVRGACVFLRLTYDDGSWTDLRTQPQTEVCFEYVERSQTVQIPAEPEGRMLSRATLWAYAWVQAGESEVSGASLWAAYFDDIFCIKTSA